MKSKLALVILLFLFSLTVYCEDSKEQKLAKEISTGIEETTKEIGDGRFVLISFINGSIEIIQPIKPQKEWTKEYKQALEEKIESTIKRGGIVFQLLQLKEKQGKLI
jgi:hypothetical protein